MKQKTNFMDNLLQKTNRLHSHGLSVLFIVALLLSSVPGSGQVQSLYLQNTQTQSGATGSVFDLSNQIGTANTVTSSATNSTTFSQTLAFTLDIGSLSFSFPEKFPVSLDVSDVSSSNSETRFRLQRINSSGTIVASTNYSPVFNTIGIKNTILSFSTVQTWSTSDRIRLSIEVRRITSGSNTRTITIRTGDVDSRVFAPAGSTITESFISGATFETQNCVQQLTVEAWGGGGGGFNGSASGGGKGGGGGGYAKGTIANASGNYTIVVGVGGGENTNGTQTTFGSTLVVANGGSGGGNETTSGGIGGSANTSGVTNFTTATGGTGGNGDGTDDAGGGGGGSAGPNGNGANGSNATSSLGGNGGKGNNNAGGNGGTASGGNDGNNGSDNVLGGGGGAGGDNGKIGGNGGFPGGGGGGGENGGGTGANGLVVVTYNLPNNPTITLTNVTATACFSASAQNVTLAYSATTGCPDKYSISFTSALISDVADVDLSGSSITIELPANLPANTYDATLILKNSTYGFVSSSYSITVTLNPLPTVASTSNNTKTYTGIANTTTVSASASSGSTINWYSAITGGSLLGSGSTYTPVGVNAGVYTVYAEAVNSTTGCVSSARTGVTLTINKANLNITAGTQTVCFGTPSATVTSGGSYSATGFVNNETVSVIGGSSSYTTTYTPTTPAGTSGVTITPVVSALTATNYTFNPVNGTITINATSSIEGALTGTSSVCSGSSASLNLTGSYTGSVFGWEYADNAAFTNLTPVSHPFANYTTPALNQTRYYRVIVKSGVCPSVTSNAVLVTVNSTGTWIGGASGNWNLAANWCGGVPSSSAVITNNAVVTLNTSSLVTVTNLTLNSGSILIIPNGAKLTISGALVNNGGTLKIESGGSLVQEGSTANSGTGTYVAERYMTGSGGSTPSGRHWYMGVPMSGSTSASLNAAGDNRLWYYNEPTAGYVEITDNSTTLDQSKGYVFRGGADGTYSFSSNNIGNGSTTFNLTRTPGVAKTGFNLLSNPYPSHLNLNNLYQSTVTSGTSPLLPTVWYRTNNGTAMLFDTYNLSTGVGTANNSMSQQVTGSVAPFQSFWVRLNEGTSLQMTATNAMRSHGTQNFLTLTPATVRLNISNGTYHDETIVVLNEDLSNDYDYRDSGKEIPSTTVHQLYSLEGSTRVAINGIANALAKDSLKLGVQIPTAGTYSINCTELTFSDMVFLEDKLTGSYLELNSTTNYSFTSVAGTFNNRFVLHFAPYVPALPGQTAATAIAMPTSNWPQCNNVSTEDQWHAFTATSEGISIEVNTATADLTIELQDGTGNVVAQENAVNGIGNETLNFFGLTAGQTYKVGVRNNISSQPTGTYGICVKSLKRGGCDYGAGPYSLCQYYKATWAGSTGVSYTFTFTGTSGPAAGQTFTRTQNSDICVLSTVTPLLPYGSTYDVVISNTYTLTDGAGNTEQITVPSINGCQVITIAEPQTALSNSSSCNNGARFRGAVVSSMPWVCGSNNWRWRFTEVNPLTMQEVGLPIELNRGSASNYLSLGTVAQLQNGKTYAVQTAPMFSYTGTNYNWGPTQYLCIVGAAQGMLQDAEQGAEQGSTKDALQGASQVETLVYVTEGNQVNIQLTNTANNSAKRADIYDVTGKLVKSVRLVEGMNEVTLTETAGIYMVRTVVGNQSETTRVFLNN